MTTSSRRGGGHAARERALGLLYEAESKATTPTAVLDDLVVPPDRTVELLVRGVQEHGDEIDALLGRYAEGWTVARMPAIDRAVCRMAAFELLARPEVPTAVVLDEAVELAKQYSTDDSGRFVNGLMGRVARELRAG